MNSRTADFGQSGENVARYPLLTALRERRSRRFGLGMKIPAGPLAFASRHAARSLTEDEEAALVFSACGVTGHALADLCYAPAVAAGSWLVLSRAPSPAAMDCKRSLSLS